MPHLDFTLIREYVSEALGHARNRERWKPRNIYISMRNAQGMSCCLVVITIGPAVAIMARLHDA